MYNIIPKIVLTPSTYILCGLIFFAFFAPFMALYNPYDLHFVFIEDQLLSPFSSTDRHFYLLGTDGLGRDLYSAILYGLRTSLLIALSSAFFAFLVGTLIGIVAGYYGGIFEDICMRLVDIMLSLPSILIALFFMALFGKGLEKLFVALIFVQWAYFARTARGICIFEKNKAYIDAAKSLNFSSFRIILFHIFPSCLSPLIILGVSQIGHAIALEATLSFFGLGLPITHPSLGLLISNGFNVIFSGHYWVSLFPGLTLFLLVFALNFMSETYRKNRNPLWYV